MEKLSKDRHTKKKKKGKIGHRQNRRYYRRIQKNKDGSSIR
jgi:hypothetical protein